jgi:DhnA family fructose-bisphosphate aldolase class Ia
MKGLDYRLKEFLPASGRSAVLVDTSAGLALGALPGLEDFQKAVRPLLPIVEGVVCSPGQLRRLGSRTRGEAALLVRMDWTNTLRGEGFTLPPEKISYLTLLDAGEALALGATGMVLSFLLGYEEAVEAACLKATVQLALKGKDLGLPLVVEVCPGGPRVSLPGKAVELGASYALEGGADVVVLPQPGPDSLETISNMLSVPWLLKPASADSADTEWESARGLGAAGLWLDHTWLAPDMPLAGLAARVHQAPEQKLDGPHG